MLYMFVSFQEKQQIWKNISIYVVTFLLSRKYKFITNFSKWEKAILVKNPWNPFLTLFRAPCYRLISSYLVNVPYTNFQEQTSERVGYSHLL